MLINIKIYIYKIKYIFMWVSSKEYRDLYRISSQQLYQLLKRNKLEVKQIS